MRLKQISREQLESLRKRYPAGTKVCLKEMEGEAQMPSGLKGEVCHVDDMGQIHVNWENGSGLALVPGVDSFSKASDPQKQKGGQTLSR